MSAAVFGLIGALIGALAGTFGGQWLSDRQRRRGIATDLYLVDLPRLSEAATDLSGGLLVNDVLPAVPDFSERADNVLRRSILLRHDRWTSRIGKAAFDVRLRLWRDGRESREGDEEAVQVLGDACTGYLQYLGDELRKPWWRKV